MQKRRTKSTATYPEVNDHPNDTVFSLSASEVRDLIARRAYEIYTHREAECGDETSDWLSAEAEVVSMLLVEPQQTYLTEEPKGLMRARRPSEPGPSKTADGRRRGVSGGSKRNNALKANPA
jgi:hypothetical protein